MKAVRILVVVVLVGAAGFFGWKFWRQYNENKVLKEVVGRLTADSRIAEVLVRDVKVDVTSGVSRTTIKFLEYDTQGRAMEPRYFTFTGNVIQFQSMVIRFEDKFVKYGDALRGKSVYVFLKAFTLKGKDTEEFEITKVNDVPGGYEVGGDVKKNEFERRLWREFWEYAMGEGEKAAGVKNAQIEAPGTRFVPGMVYTIRIEHDGGMRIDAEKIREIYKGEKIE
jgi:hypothetical protein